METPYYTYQEKERIKFLKDALSKAHKVPKSDKRTNFINRCNWMINEVNAKAALRRRRDEIFEGVPVVEITRKDII